MIRAKRFMISPQTMVEHMFRQGHVVRVAVGIPDDAKLLRAGYDADTDMFYVTIYGRNFDEVRDGEIIPTGDIVLEEQGAAR